MNSPSRVEVPWKSPSFRFMEQHQRYNRILAGQAAHAVEVAGFYGEAIGMSPSAGDVTTRSGSASHDDRPSDCSTPDHPRACTCGAPGMPCPDCNARADPRDTPKMPPAFRVTMDGKGPRN